MTDFAALPLPLPQWKAAGASRPWTPFSATYSQTRDLLSKEARELGARSILIQVVTAGGNTRGGNLRSDARVDHPGVVVTLDTAKSGVLVFETDRYRGHIANTGQQFAGFREIGSGTIELGAGMTVDQAARLLGDAANEPWEDIHPDVGGDPALFATLVQARDVLNRSGR